MHTLVRALERDVKKLEDEIRILETRLSRLRGDDEAIVARRERLQARIDAEKAERDAILARIPAEWDDVHKTFALLTQAETKAGNAYRRAADGAYSPVAEVVDLLEGAGPLKVLRSQIAGLADSLTTMDNEEAVDQLRALEDATGDIADAGGVRSPLSEARRALEGEGDNRSQAQESVAEALEATDAELAWRQPAADALLPKLGAYEEAIRANIGLRQLQRFPREQALAVASCNASHRDVSLNF
jgi:chromosome segregation ATPase